MSIKEFVLHTQRHIRSAVVVPIKRSHVYELMAAAFGYRTYAALCSESVFTRRSGSSAVDGYDQVAVVARCRDLGYETAADKITSHFLAALSAERIDVIHVDAVIAGLLSQDYDADPGWPDPEAAASQVDSSSDQTGDWYSCEDELPDVLIESLETAAGRSNADAHYALALLHRTDSDEDVPQERGSRYWYEQRQAGTELSAVANEWADDFERGLEQAQRAERHLREAARLGNLEAQLDLADLFGEPMFFERQPSAADVDDPARAAEIAGRLGRPQDEHHWLTVAAESGDIDSMRTLIETYDQSDLIKCWAWLHFAKLLGTDLTTPNMRAYHDGGPHSDQEYDDDIGGPAYVAGDEGIRLGSLSPADDASAQKLADEMYRRFLLSGSPVES